ncbi:MAG TPA: redoxin domain-containing protein [Spirochaetota bacterium]|nr:redoxin domain-containing protein [Spirochaetota bacterium]HSA14460.1 redoxin domain-containing protein [Spirochaetota bacterium]
MNKMLLAALIIVAGCSSGSDAPCPCSKPDAACLQPCGRESAPGSCIGRVLPDIRLDAFYNGRFVKVSPRQYSRKWVILFFYPADFTFVCPTELKELADYYNEFTAMGAEILSVSTDSVYVHRAWKSSNKDLGGVRYPMLSDRTGALSRMLGVYDGAQGCADRATFLADPDGRIVACEFHHESIGRSADELLRKLAAAQAVREGSGGYCPAGWKAGQEIIHPEQ